MQKKKIIVVVGATGSGKSNLAHKIAKHIGGYLISADSRQVFKNMNIGTNKDNGKWLRKGFKKHYIVDGVEEFMVDIVNPNKPFSLDHWLKQVKKIIDIEKSDPVVVGGTGLYTSALVHGYALPGAPNKSFRQKIESEYQQHGLEYMVKKLVQQDPDIEQKIDTSNPRRVMRAFELLRTAGTIEKKSNLEPKFDFLVLGLEKNREELYRKIDTRVDQMITEGLVEEVKFLIKKGYKSDSPAMTGIGYRQIVDSLNGIHDLNEAIRLIKRDTRHYAKRQLTWYRKDDYIHWISSPKQAIKLVSAFLSNT